MKLRIPKIYEDNSIKFVKLFWTLILMRKGKNTNYNRTLKTGMHVTWGSEGLWVEDAEWGEEKNGTFGLWEVVDACEKSDKVCNERRE